MPSRVVGLLKVHKAYVQRPFGQPCLVDEVAQGKEMMDCTLAKSDSSLCRAVEAAMFSPAHEARLQDDGVEPVYRGSPTTLGL